LLELLTDIHVRELDGLGLWLRTWWALRGLDRLRFGLWLRLWGWLALDDTILGAPTWANVLIVGIVLRRCLSLGCLP
jgi:hypothetical protein